MKKIEADSLEDALIKASNEFNCSVIDLEYEIIQNPSKGFLGFGKKSSIICVEPKIKTTKEESKRKSTAFNTQNPIFFTTRKGYSNYCKNYPTRIKRITRPTPL